MNLLVASIYLLLLLNTCNHAFGQLLDCDCAPLRYTFDVFYQRGCDTVSLSGFSNDAIDETGVTCSVTGLWSPGGIYAYNATILNVRSTDANRYEITNSPFDPAADSFQISFLGPFGGDNGAPIMKDNYSSGLDIELNIFRSLQDYILIRRMEVFIPYTGLCDQIVFSDGDELAWLTFVSFAYFPFICVLFDYFSSLFSIESFKTRMVLSLLVL